MQTQTLEHRSTFDERPGESRVQNLKDKARRGADRVKVRADRVRETVDWNKVGIGVGAAALLAGAAVAARRMADGRSDEEEFQLRLQTDENLRLISSKKVEGTPVVDRDGARIGHIDNFMVDKYTGRVAYAVMRFGGTFGFGTSLFPLPWAVLDYDEEMGGYRLEIGKGEMADAPRFEETDEPEFDRDYRSRIILFYRSA